MRSRKLFRYTFRHWTDLDSDLMHRVRRLRENSRKLKALGRANAFQLAATDLFVEKATIHLTGRARANTMAGASLGLVCMVLLGFALWIVVHDESYLKFAAKWELVTIFALRGAALAGFLGATIYFLASLSRAFFHEATTLYSRRHALRFGRMFIYLKYGESRIERVFLLRAMRAYPLGATATVASEALVTGDARTKIDFNRLRDSHEHLLSYIIHRDIDAAELEKAFGWNLETYTGFRDMRPEHMSANVYSRTIEVMGKLVESVAKLKTEGKVER